MPRAPRIWRAAGATHGSPHPRTRKGESLGVVFADGGVSWGPRS